MTLDELVLLERQLPRALASVRAFCDAKTTALLDRLVHLVAEARHAAYFLCDPDCPERIREQSQERFLRAAFSLPARSVGNGVFSLRAPTEAFQPAMAEASKSNPLTALVLEDRAASGLAAGGPVELDPTFNLCEIADACIDAEISDGHYQSLEIALLDRRGRHG